MMLTISQCKNNFLYIIRARNAKLGIFDSKSNSFKIRRKRFNLIYIDRELHWDEDEVFGTAQPYEEVEKTPKFPDDDAMLDYLKDKENELKEEISEVLSSRKKLNR